jgi:large subunit ribosomal protein L35Ae
MLTWDVYRGRHLSYQRGKRNTNPGTSLIQIEGVENTEAAKYVGKLVCMKGRY